MKQPKLLPITSILYTVLILIGCTSLPAQLGDLPTPVSTTNTTAAVTSTPASKPPTPNASVPEAIAKPKAGYWRGQDVSFIVTEANTITDFESLINGCQVTMNDEIPIKPNDSFGSFAVNPEGVLQGSSAETATDLNTEATFESETALQGVYTMQLCAATIYFNQTDIGWTAEWQEPLN